MKNAKERNAEEYRLQCALVEILQILENQGEIRGFYHWPNGMRVSIGQAVKFKRMGMKAGPWDLYVVLNGGDILWIECKSEKGVLSEEQKKFRDIHEGAERIFFREVRSVAEAIEKLDRLRW